MFADNQPDQLYRAFSEISLKCPGFKERLKEFLTLSDEPWIDLEKHPELYLSVHWDTQITDKECIVKQGSGIPPYDSDFYITNKVVETDCYCIPYTGQRYMISFNIIVRDNISVLKQFIEIFPECVIVKSHVDIEELVNDCGKYKYYNLDMVVLTDEPEKACLLFTHDLKDLEVTITATDLVANRMTTKYDKTGPVWRCEKYSLIIHQNCESIKRHDRAIDTRLEVHL